MNKSDLLLIGVVAFLATICLLFFFGTKKEGNKIANVYYDRNLTLQIDLSLKEPKEYIVKGANGDVKIKTEDGKIKVEEENSPRHLCSKQGWIHESYESIICLPNKITIDIEAQTDIDTVVK